MSKLASPVVFQRIEGGLLFIVSLLGCYQSNINWWLFPVLWLVVDVSAAGYLAGPKFGALVYNIGHTATIPLALIAYRFITPFAEHHVLQLGALIWLNHIGFDRLMGFGLKFSTAFQDTNLGRIGRG